MIFPTREPAKLPNSPFIFPNGTSGRTADHFVVDGYRLLDHSEDPLGELDALDLDTELDDAVVVAFGGNALVNTPPEQLEAIRQTALMVCRRFSASSKTLE